MKYILSDEALEKEGMTMPEFLVGLLCLESDNLYQAINSVAEKDWIVEESRGSGSFVITHGFKDRIDNILLSRDPDVPPTDRLEALAGKMQECFPSGKKEGSIYYWKGNKRELVLKLQKFFKLYGNSVTDDQIVTATKKYVDSFNGNYKYMRLLKYFILKFDRVPDGQGIEQVSELASMLENDGQENSQYINNDWTQTLR